MSKENEITMDCIRFVSSYNKSTT